MTENINAYTDKKEQKKELTRISEPSPRELQADLSMFFQSF